MLYRYHLFRHKFCVFLKLRFSDKRFSSWPQACHKIILPVQMLRMLRTLFCLDTSFFFLYLRYSATFAVSRLSTLRLTVAVGMFLGASISSDHFPSFENVENFVLSWNIQNVHPFHPSIGHGSESTQLDDTLQCKCQVLCTKMIATRCKYCGMVISGPQILTETTEISPKP